MWRGESRMSPEWVHTGCPLATLVFFFTIEWLIVVPRSSYVHLYSHYLLCGICPQTAVSECDVVFSALFDLNVPVAFSWRAQKEKIIRMILYIQLYFIIVEVNALVFISLLVSEIFTRFNHTFPRLISYLNLANFPFKLASMCTSKRLPARLQLESNLVEEG